MQAFRKISAPRALLRAANWKKPASIQVMNMSLRSQTFAPDEFNGPHDDDYHRSAEEIRQRKQMRANFMRIQALPEHAYEKWVMKEFLGND